MTAIGLAALALLLAGLDPPPTPHVRGRLIAEVASVRPDQPFYVGLHLSMDPGWHTYWLNPGDSGLPTRMAWTPADGVSTAPLEWPTPSAFGTGPLVSYGYSGEVLLLARVTPAATLRPGQSLTLGGRASWLECKEICIPGRVELSLTLPVALEAPPPSPEAGRFAETRDRLPRPATGWRITASREERRLTLALSPPAGAPPIGDGATFFAEQTGLVEHGEPQKLQRLARGARLEIPLSANPTRIPERLRGVLLVPGRQGAETSLAVDVPLSGATQSSSKGDRP